MGCGQVLGAKANIMCMKVNIDNIREHNSSELREEIRLKLLHGDINKNTMSKSQEIINLVLCDICYYSLGKNIGH